MADAKARTDVAERVIDSLKTGENQALEAVHKFLDAVNSAFPDVGGDGAPRQKIIDSAFKMTEQLVGTASDVAKHLAKVTKDALTEAEDAGKSSKG
jgi:hypothetical protein